MMLMHLRNLEKRSQRTQKNKWHTTASIAILEWNAWEDDFQKVLAHEKTHLNNQTEKTK